MAKEFFDLDKSVEEFSQLSLSECHPELDKVLDAINDDYNHPVIVFLSYNMSTYVTVRIPAYNITTIYMPD